MMPPRDTWWFTWYCTIQYGVLVNHASLADDARTRTWFLGRRLICISSSPLLLKHSTTDTSNFGDDARTELTAPFVPFILGILRTRAPFKMRLFQSMNAEADVWGCTTAALFTLKDIWRRTPHGAVTSRSQHGTEKAGYGTGYWCQSNGK